MAVESHKVRFNLEKAPDQEAWTIVQSVPRGKRNRFIIEAINGYARSLDDEAQQERLAQRIAALVADKLTAGSATVVSVTPDAPFKPDISTQEQSLAIADDFLSNWA